MKNTLNIGSIKLPKESATKGFGFIGKRGSGKSYGAAVFAEELYDAKIPFVVFDPIDVWWGLKVAADGKGKGLPIVVFGKEHADIQLDRTMGRKIAEAVVRENISCVISTFGLNKTEMREIIADFSERLLQINNTPRQVIIEEAHEFVPQRVQGGATKCFAAVEALLVMGRNRGIGVTLLNQRMATLNKDLLTQIDVLVAFRSVGPQDRRAFKDWVEVHNDENDENFDEFMKSVPSLTTGHAWIWSPEFLELFAKVKFRPRRTFHPDREKLGMMFKMPEIKQGDVQAFIDSFAKKPVVATPKKTAQVAVQVKTQVDNKAIEKAVAARDEYWRKEIEKERASWRRLLNHMDKIHLQASNLFAGSKRPDLYLTGGQKIVAPKIEKSFNHTVTGRALLPLSKDMSYNGKRGPGVVDMDTDKFVDIGMRTKPEQKVLDAIAWMNAIGVDAPSKTAVALIAKVRPTSGGFKNSCGALRSKGLVNYPTPGDIELTAEGKEMANAPEFEALTDFDFHKVILGALKDPERRVLIPLLELGGNDISKDELATLVPCEPTSGGYKNILGQLRTLGLIDYPTPGRVHATKLMYPFS